MAEADVGRALALTILALAAISAGCGGKHAAPSTACISIFLVPDANGAQIRGVRQRLGELDARIGTVRFVSKKQALAQMRRRYPNLVRGMPFNPLPASFRIRPRLGSDDKALVRALKPRPSGVHVVRYVPKRRRC
jgi:cell division protein FtsX